MAALIPLGFAQVNLRWTLTGDLEEMVSTIGITLDGTSETPEAVAQSVATYWLAAWPAASLSNAYQFVGATAYVGQDGGPPASGEYLINSSGGSSSAKLPNNCAVLVRKNTGTGGRRNRGRMYLPAGYIDEGQVDNLGVINGAVVTSMQSQMNAFRTALAGSGEVGVPVILHSELPSTPTVVTSFSVQTRIATQRKRLRR